MAYDSNETVKKKLIFLFARDPGGANVIASITKPLISSGYNAQLYGKDFALSKFEGFDLNGIDLSTLMTECSYQNLMLLIQKINPQLIVTGTSADDFTDRYLWRIGDALGIPTVAILDQWINYGIRFSDYSVKDIHGYMMDKRHVYMPDQIWALDEYAKEQAILDGLPKDRLIVTGQPYFTYLKELKRSMSKDETINASLTDVKSIKIVYGSEPITLTYSNTSKDGYFIGYNEKEILRYLYQALQKIVQNADIVVELILRPHPKEPEDNLIQIIETCGHSERIRVTVDKSSDSIDLVCHSDLVVGMSSMFLLESAVMGIPVMSVQIGLKRESPFMLDQLGIIPSLLSEEDLLEALKAFIIYGKVEAAIWSKEWPSMSSYIERVNQILCQY